ncbi:hypothetical protein Scep_005943 [Stephania cephalantha]|uniref:Uncharacterized protein n=1 Tax=Stephania cephalantha TaxID=152367 RepID=A0AAP0PYN2_9MAGN
MNGHQEQNLIWHEIGLNVLIKDCNFRVLLFKEYHKNCFLQKFKKYCFYPRKKNLKKVTTYQLYQERYHQKNSHATTEPGKNLPMIELKNSLQRARRKSTKVWDKGLEN